MTAQQTELVARARALIGDRAAVREVSMFGGRSVMVNEKMIVSVHKSGRLLVRVDARRHDELVDRPGATQAEMGQGREMGAGWIDVAAEAVRDDDELSFWIGIAMDHNRAVTADRPSAP